MTRGKLIIFTEPASPDVEADFNAWYDDVHIPEVVAVVPGVVSGARFKAVAGQPNNFPGAPTYVAIYDIDIDDITVTMAGLASAAQSGTLHMTHTMKMTEPPLTMFVEEFGA